MKSTHPLWLGLAVLTASACGQGDDVEPAAVAQAVEEIPVTTSSAEALADFQAGREARDRGHYREANALFESAADKDPAFAYAFLEIAASGASTKEFSDNLERAAQNLEGKSAGEGLLVEIFQTFFDNDAEKRIELALELVDAYPRSPRAWLVLAEVQTGLNQHQAARESLRQARELDPRQIAVHMSNWYSYLFREPKDFARAEEAMQRALEIAPEEARVHENLGDVHRAMGQLERARDAYTRAVELDPTQSAGNIKKGHINSFLGEYEQARADYDAGVEGAEGQDRISYANYRAFTHLHAGDPRGALDELQALAAAADELGIPEDQVVGPKIFTLNNQAMIALHYGLFADGERILEQLTALIRESAGRVGDPDFSRLQEANILLWQARFAARRGDYEAARELAEKNRELLANDKNPRRFEGYHGVLGMIEQLRGNYAEAIEEMKKSDLNMMYLKYHLAQAEEGAGNVEAAKALFKEVAEWNFNSVGYAMVRKDALARAQ